MRLARRHKFGFPMNELVALQKAFNRGMDLALGIQGSDAVAYRLIQRYWDKVSPRLKNRAEALEREAPAKAKQVLMEEMAKPSFMLGKVAKKAELRGGVFMVPLSYGDWVIG